MKITLDTNVLVSGTFWEGEAFRIIQLIQQKRVQCFLSKDILQEYEAVLHSGEIVEKTYENHLSVKSAFIKALELCTIVEPKRRVAVVKEDPADNMILECAIEANVDYLITYDAKHLLKLGEFEGIKIISPAQFLRIIEK